MSALSDFLEVELLDHILRNAAYASPTTVYIALYTDNPTDADVGTECAGATYARLAVAFNAPVDGADGSKVCKNTAQIEFLEATDAWGTISHFAIRDKIDEGPPTSNMLYHGAFTVPKLIESGDQFIIKATELVIGLK